MNLNSVKETVVNDIEFELSTYIWNKFDHIVWMKAWAATSSLSILRPILGTIYNVTKTQM
jgi:hypothetical protein